jgi:hypothetical protein
MWVVSAMLSTALLVALALTACTRGTTAGAAGGSDAAEPRSSASATASIRPRKPELKEVASAPYYAAFEPIDWPQAERLLRNGRVTWVEENQAGRAYVKTFDADGRTVKQAVTEVPPGLDLAALAREIHGPGLDGPLVNHSRYEQIPWSRAVALLRGQVVETRVTAIFAAHQDRVFLHTAAGEDFLAIQSPIEALLKLLTEVDPNHEKFSFVLE